jgi:tRNA-guanine transglycosylase
MNSFRFEVILGDKKTKARLGRIITSHGIIRTPAFVPVGTAASIKALIPSEIKSCNIDVFFVNTYHMLFRPGIDVVEKMGGLHKFMNWDGPLMTDSGGFQIFSLSEYGLRQNFADVRKLVKITNKGTFFKSVWDGKTMFLGPGQSIAAQQKLDSDIMMAFDECTFYPIKKERARQAMQRTHNWALVCLLQHTKEKNSKRALYGIVQGSIFKELRKESTKFIADLPFDGFAIGSVANSREPRQKVFAVLDWTLDKLLTKQKPIHFLGIGEIEDIILSIEKGIDSLDCITPTRLGRMGWIFTKAAGLKNKFRYDITKSSFSADKDPPDKNCHCFTCKNFTRAYLNHLFRCRELLAYRLATIHNLYFFGNFMEAIREEIAEGKFLRLKKYWLT